MRNYIAILGLISLVAPAVLISVPVARAAVTIGSAANVPDAAVGSASKALNQASHANVGPLAPSLQGKPVVVRIHADWCIACKATHATISEVKKAYAGKINFVEFDVTNAKTAAGAYAKAQKLGLTKFYNAAKAQTSTVAVINPQTGEVYATFYNDGSLKDYEGAINTALKAE